MNYFIENTVSTMIYYEDKKAGTKYELYKIFFFFPYCPYSAFRNKKAPNENIGVKNRVMYNYVYIKCRKQ